MPEGLGTTPRRVGVARDEEAVQMTTTATATTVSIGRKPVPVTLTDNAVKRTWLSGSRSVPEGARGTATRCSSTPRWPRTMWCGTSVG